MCWDTHWVLLFYQQAECNSRAELQVCRPLERAPFTEYTNLFSFFCSQPSVSLFCLFKCIPKLYFSILFMQLLFLSRRGSPRLHQSGLGEATFLFQLPHQTNCQLITSCYRKFSLGFYMHSMKNHKSWAPITTISKPWTQQQSVWVCRKTEPSQPLPPFTVMNGPPVFVKATRSASTKGSDHE